MNDIIRACTAIVDSIEDVLHLKLDEVNNANDFFYCLGGALAKLIEKVGVDAKQPGAADSFMEGFSSYRRFLKDTDQASDAAHPLGLDWLLDNKVSSN